MSKKEKEFKCRYCEKTFTMKHNRDNHEKNYCKLNPKEEVIKEIIDEVIEEPIKLVIQTTMEEQEPIKDLPVYEIKDLVITKLEPIIPLKPKYTDNELYILKIFKNFNHSNIEVRKDISDKLVKIYLTDYNRKIGCDCASEYIKMYLFLNKKKVEIINR